MNLPTIPNQSPPDRGALRVRRSVTVSACHRVASFGPGHKCSRPHGHNWRIDVECSGPLDMATGVIVDCGAIKAAIDSLGLDHADFNEVLGTADATMEVLAVYIYGQLSLHPDLNGRIVAVEVHESAQQSCRFEPGGGR